MGEGDALLQIVLTLPGAVLTSVVPQWR